MCKLKALVHESTSSFQGLETHICLKCCFYLSLQIVSSVQVHYSFYIRLQTSVEQTKLYCNCQSIFPHIRNVTANFKLLE